MPEFYLYKDSFKNLFREKSDMNVIFRINSDHNADAPIIEIFWR